MRELNEQELEQVAGGHSIFLNYGTTAAADGAASAKFGHAGSSSVTASQLSHHGSSSFAANSSWASGYKVAAGSEAQSSSGLTIAAS